MKIWISISAASAHLALPRLRKLSQWVFPTEYQQQQPSLHNCSLSIHCAHGLLLALLISRLSQGYRLPLNLSFNLYILHFAPWAQEPLVQGWFICSRRCFQEQANSYSTTAIATKKTNTRQLWGISPFVGLFLRLHDSLKSDILSG